MENQNIGKKILYLRKKHNLSQKELANKLYVSNKTISKWECGNSVPDFETIIKLAQIFNMTLDEFASNTTEKTPQPIQKTPTQNNVTHNTTLIRDRSVIKPTKLNSSTIVILIISICLLAILTITGILVYCTLQPSEPLVVSSQVFTIDQKQKSLTTTVRYSKDTINLKNSISVAKGNSWTLYADVGNGISIEIPNKVVYLSEGNNLFYIYIENTNGENKTYTLNIKRNIMCKVSFHLDNDNKEIIYVEEGFTINTQSIPLPTKPGFDFAGWNYDFTQPTLADNVNIYPIFTPKKYYIYYHNNIDDTIVKQSVTSSQNFNLLDGNTFTRAGYTLTKWSCFTKDYALGSYMLNQAFSEYVFANDYHLYAIWQPNTYKIHYHNENKELIKTIDVTFNSSTQTLPSSYTKEHYIHSGWTDNNSLEYPVSYNIKNFLATSDIHLYPTFTPINYKIYYDVEFDIENNPNPINYNIESSINLVKPIASSQNVEFDSWLLNGEPISTIPTGTHGNITLKASYKLQHIEYILEKASNLNYKDSLAVLNEKYYLPSFNSEYTYNHKVTLHGNTIATQTDAVGEYFVPTIQDTYTIKTYFLTDKRNYLSSIMYVSSTNAGNQSNLTSNFASFNIADSGLSTVSAWNSALLNLNTTKAITNTTEIDINGYAINSQGDNILDDYGNETYAFTNSYSESGIITIPTISITTPTSRNATIKCKAYNSNGYSMAFQTTPIKTTTTVDTNTITTFSGGSIQLFSELTSITFTISDYMGNNITKSFIIFSNDHTKPILIIENSNVFDECHEAGTMFIVPKASLQKYGIPFTDETWYTGWNIQPASQDAEFDLEVNNGFIPHTAGTYYVNYYATNGVEIINLDSVYALTVKDSFKPDITVDTTCPLDSKREWSGSSQLIYFPIATAVDPNFAGELDVTYTVTNANNTIITNIAVDGDYIKYDDYYKINNNTITVDGKTITLSGTETKYELSYTTIFSNATKPQAYVNVDEKYYMVQSIVVLGNPQEYYINSNNEKVVLTSETKVYQQFTESSTGEYVKQTIFKQLFNSNDTWSVVDNYGVIQEIDINNYIRYVKFGNDNTDKDYVKASLVRAFRADNQSTYTITYTATDATNISTLTKVIHVGDTCSPIISHSKVLIDISLTPKLNSSITYDMFTLNELSLYDDKTSNVELFKRLTVSVTNPNSNTTTLNTYNNKFIFNQFGQYTLKIIIRDYVGNTNVYTINLNVTQS